MPEALEFQVFLEDEENTENGGHSSWKISPLSSLLREEEEEGVRRDSSDNLFQIVPQVLITSKISEDAFPSTIISSTGGGGGELVGVVLEEELIVIEKEGGGKIRRLRFPAAIDFLLWRRSIILLGLNNSEIVLVDPNTFQVKESKKVAPSTNLQKGEKFFIDAAIHSNPDPTKIDVVAVARTGVAYAFNNVSLSEGNLDATHDQNVSVDIDYGSIRGTRITCLEERANVVALSSPARNILILCEESGAISYHDLEHLSGLPKELHFSQTVNVLQELGYSEGQEVSVKIKKLVSFEGILFLLLSDGKMELLVDPVLFSTPGPQLPDPTFIVHDFAVIFNSEGEVKLWLIYGSPCFSARFVGIFGGPQFSLEFSLKIPTTLGDDGKVVKDLLFPSQTSPFEEPYAFLELSSSGAVLYRMLETSTDITIQKLLARGKFEQALQLASECGKSLDIVYKAKARFKFLELAGIGKDTENPQAVSVFNELKLTLGQIKDAAFVCDFCCQSEFPSLTHIKELLSLGKRRVQECPTGSDSGIALLHKVKLLYTFEQVCPKGGLEEWLQFMSPENTMFQQCKFFLSKLEFAKCEKIWRRHFDEFIPSLKLDHFGPFFITLFNQKLKSPAAVSFFSCILPFAIEKCAETGEPHAEKLEYLNSIQSAKVDVLLSIAKRQICSLERERLWPMEAIEFSKTVITIVKDCMNMSMSSANTGRADPSVQIQSLIYQSILKRMEMMLLNLTELKDLKEYHSIRISFQQYIDDDVYEVVNSMLYELFQQDEIETFISKFLTPFAARKKLSVDALFLSHIQAVVADLPFHINSKDIPQEQRLICLISHVSEIKMKLRCILVIAEEWPVPWGQNIDKLVESSLGWSVPDLTCCKLQRTVKILRVQVPFRCLLNKYKLTATKVQGYNGVVMALNRIIAIKKPEYFEDCLELIKHTGCADELKIRSLEFSQLLRNRAVPVEDLVDPRWPTVLLKRLLFRCLTEFRMGPVEHIHPEDLKRITEVSKILANILDDKKALEFLKLRDLIPEINDPDVVFDDTYPFCVMNHVMPEYHNKSISDLIRICKKICDHTFTHLPDFFSVAAAYYTRGNSSPTELMKMMVLIKRIVSTPGCILGKNSLLVHNSAVAVAHHMLWNCPNLPSSFLPTLEEFLVLLTNHDKSLEETTKMLSSLKMFSSLREQEIPLEKEYKQIYLYLYIEGIRNPGHFVELLRDFGETLLKFGEQLLFRQFFGGIINEIASRIRSDGKSPYIKLLGDVSLVQAGLVVRQDTLTKPETSLEVLNLVDRLILAELYITPYALRKRDKGKYIRKLLAANHFLLAAEVGLVFKVFQDLEAWSLILSGVMSSGDEKELRKLLLNLRNVSTLWTLPEFAEGFKMVARKDQNFLDLCPIPLD